MPLVSVLALAVFAVFQWRAARPFLGNYLVCNPPPQHADLILVLGGNFYGPRVFKGADLAAQGYAPVALLAERSAVRWPSARRDGHRISLAAGLFDAPPGNLRQQRRVHHRRSRGGGAQTGSARGEGASFWLRLRFIHGERFWCFVCSAPASSLFRCLRPILNTIPIRGGWTAARGACSIPNGRRLSARWWSIRCIASKILWGCGNHAIGPLRRRTNQRPAASSHPDSTGAVGTRPPQSALCFARNQDDAVSRKTLVESAAIFAMLVSTG